MTVDTLIAEGVLRCPRCRQSLHRVAVDALACACGIRYPVTDSGVPLLVPPSPDAVTAEMQQFWRSLHDAAYGDRHQALDSRELESLVGELETMFRHRQHLASVEMPGDLTGLRVLEIGSGAGAHSALFRRRGARIYAIDITLERAIATARKLDLIQAGEGFSAQADARALPFPDDFFDIVYSNGVLHHSPEIGRSVSEVHRVLKLGGRAAIMLYAKNSFLYRGVLFPVRGILQGGVFQDRRWLGRSTEWMSSKPRSVDNPWTQVFSTSEVRQLFQPFSQVCVRKGSFTFDQLPVIGGLISRLAGRSTGWNRAGMLVYDQPWRNETNVELRLGRHIGWCLNILAVR